MVVSHGEDGPSFLTPETVLPAQFWPRVNGQPERALWRAILSDCVVCLQHPHRPRDRAEALDWINDERTIAIGSFLWFCDQFDIDADALRAALRRLPEVPARAPGAVTVRRS